VAAPSTIAAGTGYRPDEWQKFGPGCIAWARVQLCKKLVELKPVQCISGMALGWDQWLAEACIELGIPFIAAVPFFGQDSIWPKEDRYRYARLLSRASGVHYVCSDGYEPWKMHMRNRWMVARCTHLLAGWDGKAEGGTGSTVAHAMSKGFSEQNGTIVRVDPREYRP